MATEKDHKIDGYEEPPPYQALHDPPPSGFRIALNFPSDGSFPNPASTMEPPCRDADGISPVFIGSAILQHSVHPCKIAPHLLPPCRVSYGGSEVEHYGRYDLLPFDPKLMEWVPTSFGRIPYRRNPVQGGYEENGARLYHAIARVQGITVPGKTGEHLEGCNVAFANGEHVIKEDYRILCWKR